VKIYLDDDSVNPRLVRLLTGAGHDVLIPAGVGLAGKADPVHFMHAIGDGRVLLPHNHEDFELLHRLVLFVSGHHPGVWAVRRDNDPTRDMNPQRIVRAIRRLLAAAVPIADQIYVLNHWR
jgi:predicted nuclease of predicted toxin-antitoxin system